jgi:alpha-N-arabinofuranosidase
VPDKIGSGPKEINMSDSLTRRPFIAGAAASLFSALTAKKSLSYQTRARNIAVQAGVPVGTIRPELHGSFAEHLGTCTYGGMWVGRNSPIPNINGYRKQAVDYLRELGIPVLRWPGGCFADDYHWRDGIGPVEKRPKRVNIWWGNYTEDNSFGTHEFIGLCKLIGAEPYIAGNVGSGTPKELREWVEYCNYPSGSTLSDERAANGSPEPFRVRHWGVGNENWGCGGNMTPEVYADHYSKFATFIHAFGGASPILVACGPNGNDLNWTRRFFDSLRQYRRPPNAYSMHFYSGGKNLATKFTVENMREQLASFVTMEKGIVQQRALMDSYDPERKIGLMMDEWGVWDRMDPEEEKRYGRLWQQITMRSAVAAALGLNVFHRQADKLYMCNIAQTVNVLHAVVLTDGERGLRALRTSTWYAFELLKPHRGNSSLRVDAESAEPVGLSVSASRQGNQLVLTCVNARHDEAMEVKCAIAGAQASGGAARILNHADYNACNTFEQPNTIVPKPHSIDVGRSSVTLDLPPLSIVTATLALA